MKLSYIDEGRVLLIAGGGKIYSDVAARFSRSTKNLDDIIGAPHSKELLKKIVDSGHESALEFDTFIFGIEGYSRVTEIQLIRKRMASYLIKSAGADRNGKDEFSVVVPRDEGLDLAKGRIEVAPSQILVTERNKSWFLSDILCNRWKYKVQVFLGNIDILNLLESFYDDATKKHGVSPEMARYYKPQATEFKAIVAMNAHALRDWFGKRLCNRAQPEIRNLASKMYDHCMRCAPELFEGCGPDCIKYGCCSEVEQCKEKKGKVPTREQLKELAKTYYKGEEKANVKK